MKTGMLSQEEILKTISRREELIAPVEKILKPSTLELLRKYPMLAIGEIAGRDSAAAILKALEREDIQTLLPAAIYTGTEYGDWQAPLRCIEFIRKEAKRRFGKEILDLVVLGSPRFWHALNGRFITLLFDRFGFYSPCPGCHLYFHLACVPLARALGCSYIIAGDRESHGGREKLNQTSLAIDAYIKSLKEFGIELLEPLRKVKVEKEIEELIGKEWKEGEGQLKCVLSSNYLDLQEALHFQEESVQRYFNEFAIPAARKILENLIAGENPDYVTTIKKILRELK